MSENIKKNSEILFIYDAKNCNPNGDMDNDNKPRMDYNDDAKINLVSDVRLKRYIRDYLEIIENKELFVTNKAKDSKERKLQLNKLNPKMEQKNCIDVKLFGAVLAAEGGNDHFTGPIQFNWGTSINQVDLQDSKTITSSFSSGKGIGQTYNVKYSLISFSGSINSNLVGEETNLVNLTQDDLNLFDKSIIRAIPLNRTRSKIGQTPRIYLRVELKNKEYFLKDLREYITIKKEKDLNSINDVDFDFLELKEYLIKNKEKIEKIYYFVDDKIKNFEELKFCEDLFEELKF
jgi:CRISPR-associated protein Csh2